MTQRENFRRENRLKTRTDFANCYRRGVSFSARPFALRVLTTDDTRRRIGFSISAKAVRLATRRSRLRRLLREVFRRHMRYLREGVDIIVSVRSDPGTAFDYHQAEKLFLTVARNAKLLLSNHADD